MSAAEGLTREQVLSVYRQVLDRMPLDEEVEHQLATLSSLEELLRVALDSDEYAARLGPERHPPRTAHATAVVNVFHPDFAQWGHQPGKRSDDGIAIVGHEGWLFLCGGTNANLGQYVGQIEMEPTWLDEWREVVAQREAQARALRVPTALVIVPDKLAVYEQHYPESLVRAGPRPVERMLASGDLPVVYPLAQLRDAATREAVYLRTDTHLSFRGNALLFDAVRDALAFDAALDLDELPVRSYVAPGDLGVKFEPSIVEVITSPGTLHRARIAEDNREAIAAAGGHIGTRRVFVNDDAPDARTIVVFGDSFGFAADNYQGLAWFLAQVFHETHFVWVPFGWDPDYVRAVGAGLVVMQGAERFAARVPRPAVEVAALERDALGLQQPLGFDAAFGR